MGFDSEECFTEMDKNENVTYGIRVKVLKLDSIVIKKATEEGTSGEGQSPFGKRTKHDNFVDTFHGERVAKRKTPIHKIFLLKKTTYN
jgi:hypothetical protein